VRQTGVAMGDIRAHGTAHWKIIKGRISILHKMKNGDAALQHFLQHLFVTRDTGGRQKYEN
jgi:hypothetical protein